PGPFVAGPALASVPAGAVRPPAPGGVGPRRGAHPARRADHGPRGRRVEPGHHRGGSAMIRPWLPLLVKLAIGVAPALAPYFVCTLFGLYLPLPILVSVGLACGAIWWIIDEGADRADQLHAPALDLDADYALPHAQDTRVRRLEDLAHGAQPSRRMTSRGLA